MNNNSNTNNNYSNPNQSTSVVTKEKVEAYIKACNVFKVDPYKKLDFESINLTYRRIAKQYHPDINKSRDAVTKMTIINNAFSVLKNDYDEKGTYASYALMYRNKTGYFKNVKQEKSVNTEDPNYVALKEEVNFTLFGYINLFLTFILVIFITLLLAYNLYPTFTPNLNLYIVVPLLLLLVLYVIGLFINKLLCPRMIYFITNVITLIALIFIMIGTLGL